MSGHHRTIKLPVCTTTLRSKVDPCLYGTVDSTLKLLRTCYRRISEAASQLADESRILERLYYKGLNQHRNALFWRNISEIRRHTRRITEVGIQELAEQLRYSFFFQDTECVTISYLCLSTDIHPYYLTEMLLGSRNS